MATATQRIGPISHRASSDGCRRAIIRTDPTAPNNGWSVDVWHIDDTQTAEVTYQSPQPHGQVGAAPKRSFRRTWSRLTAIQKAALILAVIFLPCCGGLGGLAAIGAAIDAPAAKTDKAAEIGTSAPVSEPTAVLPTTPVAIAPMTTTAGTTPIATPTPVVVKHTLREAKRIPFKTRTVKDSSMAEGTRTVRVKGVSGVRTLTYEITVTDGVQTNKRLINSVITKSPVTKVIAVGTENEPECDPNYSGECVPIASDVDCGGGSGNGPAYVYGVVKVIGSDIYDLDRDNDGYGCD